MKYPFAILAWVVVLLADVAFIAFKTVWHLRLPRGIGGPLGEPSPFKEAAEAFQWFIRKR